MEQVTIFDVIPVPELDFRDLTIEEIAREIANATGLVFKQSRNSDTLVAIEGPKEFDIHLSRYTLNNEPFISCSYWNKKKLEGCGFPCDSLNEAIQFFRERK